MKTDFEAAIDRLFEDAISGLDQKFSAGLTDRPQTRGQEFARWFAGSKIATPDGKPIVLYHGTSKDVDFKSFKLPKNGIWFTSDPKGASEYAETNDSQGSRYEGGRFVDYNTASRVIPVFIRATNPFFVDGYPDEMNYKGNSESGVAYRKPQADYIARLRQEGHDALVIGNFSVVVAFSPDQIKSAVGNKNFDPARKGMHEGR